MDNFIRLLSSLNLISISYAASIEDTPVTISKVPTNSTSSGFGSLILFMLAFIAITGIMLILFLTITKKNTADQKGNKSIQVLDNIRMDHNSNLIVVKIQNKIHILGKTENSVSLISTIDSPDDMKILEIDCHNKSKYTFQTALTEQINSIPSIVSSKNQGTFKAANASRAFKFNSTNDKEL